jgi:hypothetical protein
MRHLSCYRSVGGSRCGHSYSAAERIGQDLPQCQHTAGKWPCPVPIRSRFRRRPYASLGGVEVPLLRKPPRSFVGAGELGRSRELGRVPTAVRMRGGLGERKRKRGLLLLAKVVPCERSETGLSHVSRLRFCGGLFWGVPNEYSIPSRSETGNPMSLALLAWFVAILRGAGLSTGERCDSDC